MATVTVQPLTLERGEYRQTTSIQSLLLEITLSYRAFHFSDFCVIGLASWACDVLVMLSSRFGLCPLGMMMVMMMNRTCSVLQDPSVCVIIMGSVFGLFLIKHLIWCMHFADAQSNALYFLYFVLISLYRRFYNFSVCKTEFEAELCYILQ